LVCAFVLALIAPAARAELPNYGFKVVHTYPHDSRAYTEGLFYLDGFLYESTGEVGGRRSARCGSRTGSGAVAQHPAGPVREGIVNWHDEIVSLTWKDQIGFRWKLDDFSQIGEFHYAGEGWALTQDGESLIKSDGSSVLHFLDPVILAETRRSRLRPRGGRSRI